MRDMDADEGFETGPLRTMYHLEASLRRFPGLHLRCSEGPVADSRSATVDGESGLELPGLPVVPLQPEDWWHRPVADWMARQLSRCMQTCERDPDCYPWVLTGQVAGRGPDCEPLIANVAPIARLAPELLVEAEARYRAHFDSDAGPGG